jgi:hypothetical protein
MDAITVEQALNAFRNANNLAANDRARAFWTCRLGPVTVPLPNFAWRREALLAHDLHHVLTGYPCSLSGECQLAAWEFGSGPMPHWGATLFCLPLVVVGFLRSPGRILRAFLSGRASRSLHRTEAAHLLARPLHEIIDELRSCPTVSRRWSDVGRFAVLLTAGISGPCGRLD